MEGKRREAYYLAEDHGYGRGWSPAPASGWWYDGRGGETLQRNFAPYPLDNVTGDAPTGLVRELRKTSAGVVTLQTTVWIKSGFDGFMIRFYDADEADAALLYTRDGAYFAVDGKGNDVSLGTESAPEGRHDFKVVLDFDRKKVAYHIDNAYRGTVSLGAKSIKFYRVGTTGTEKIGLDLGATHIHANYAINERFFFYKSGELPEGFEDASETGASVKLENNDLVLTSKRKKTAAVSKAMTPIGGKFAFESFFFMPKIKDGAGVRLFEDDKEILTFYTEKGDFCAQGEHLRYARDEIWYRLRFEIDTAKKTALIKVNGKKAGTVKIPACGGIDRVAYTLTASDALLRVDRIAAFPLIDYADYCPKPKLPKGKKDYVLGMNMCSLWHTGSHVGWDVITPYPEIKPVLGYYDEGLPEVADWEIKFMLEAGIDFQLYCWYSSQREAPIKTTGLSEAIHDGYFNCKYSEMSRFALLWEAANAAHPASLEAFKRYFVPYWIEQFFTDDRYMRIDNKAVMAVFGTWQLIRDFGSPAGVREAFDYLRSEIKKLSYDDLIIMSCGGPSKEVRDCGFDAAYAYNWGKQGYDADFTINAIERQQELNLVHVVPTASTGFNNVAWAETRSPDITVEDFKRLHETFRDKMLPTFKDKPDWTHKFVMMSNWNEYGEGTYIMPSGLNGFGYLDAVREVYTKEKGAWVNDRPNAHQLARLSYLYPQERKMIRTQNYYHAPDPSKVLKKYDFSMFGDGKIDKVYELLDLDAAYGKKKGSVVGTTHGADSKLVARKKCEINVGKATHVRLRGKVSAATTVELFYVTKDLPDWTQAQGFSFSLAPGQKEAFCVIRKQPGLDKPITGIRLDPASAAEVDYEIEGFDFMIDPTKPEFFLDGETMPLNSPVVEKDGYTLLPFNPYQVLVYRLGLYYEYVDVKKELTFYGKDASVRFVLGKRDVWINGEKHMLPSPIEVFDGLPLLPLEILADLFGFDFTYKAPKLTITTK